MSSPNNKKNMLTYAINSVGNLVYIDEVENGIKCSCFCPNCKEPLSAKNNGAIKKHHFAHVSGAECEHAYESMLHILAKERVREAFLNNQEFNIYLTQKSYCSKYNECKIRKHENIECSKAESPEPYNLKKYYDQCEQEIPYDNILRRSDLKIWSSTKPEREPIYIEFCVSHASDVEKLHSGNKIIECFIRDEKDIDYIIKNGILETESKETNWYGFVNEDFSSPEKIKASFYGFKKNKSYSNTEIHNLITVCRFLLFRSGKTQCKIVNIDCKKITKENKYSLYEICFFIHNRISVYDYAKYLGWDRYHIPNCLLCKNHVIRYDNLGRICKLYKHLQISTYEDLDSARAKTCKYFIFNQQERDEIINKGCEVPYVVLE